MARLTERARYRDGSTSRSIYLYDDEDDLGGNVSHLRVRVGSDTAYMAGSDPSDNRATLVRYRAELDGGDVTKAAWKYPMVSVPSGLIAFADATCPTGWTRVSDWDDKFLRMAAAYDLVGGGGAHTHDVTIAAGSTGYATPDDEGAMDSASGSQLVDTDILSASTYHRHSFSSQSVTSASGTVLPSYIDVIVCKKD